MNIILIFLLILAGIFVILLIAGLLIKKEFRIERHIIVNKPKQEVFNYLKNFKNGEHYNKWMMTDPGMNMLGKDLETSLSNLKNILEKK